MLNEVSLHVLEVSCTPLESLGNYSLFQHINKTITYSDVYNWDMVTLKDKEMFSLRVTKVGPAGEYTTFVNCTKYCFMLSAGMEMNCSTTTNVSYAFGHIKLPAR